MTTERQAVEHYKRTGVILPGHQATIARFIRERREDNV